LYDRCSYSNQYECCDGTEVLTSTVGMKDENKGRLVQKAKVSFTFQFSARLVPSVWMLYLFFLMFLD